MLTLKVKISLNQTKVKKYKYFQNTQNGNFKF